MHVLIVNDTKIPVLKYGGTERVIWGLGKELVALGHKVTYLVGAGSSCPFAEVLIFNQLLPINAQVPKGVDIVHLQLEPLGLKALKKPYVITMHGNRPYKSEINKNTVFVSQNHATRFGSDQFVYNGLLWDEYSQPQWDIERSYFHFLGKARWNVKNLKGACEVVTSTKSEKLIVLGGKKWDKKNGIRNILNPHIKFAGMVGGRLKDEYLNKSKGLIFPVLWHEPFGLAIIESLFYGCPIFGTTYGSLPELINGDVGFLTNTASELSNAIKNASDYCQQRCHELARDVYNSRNMTLSYLDKYHIVLNGQSLSDSPPTTPKKIEMLPWS